MRGAGKPQAMALCETIIEHLAHELKMDAKNLRELNFYKAGDETPFHQKYKDEDLHPLYVNWDRILKSSDFVNRKNQLKQFNAQNKWVKRGISIVPTRYPFHSLLMNAILKTNAFVSLLPDGSCVLSHGGIEMGQGLHTKLIQICSHELGIPIEKIVCPAVSSYGVPNAMFTGGSMGTDVNGEAIRLACEQLNQRLKPIKEKNPGKSMAEICAAAAHDGVNLTGVGFRDQPLWGNPMKDKDPLYYSWNVGVCEIELDVLTGHYRIVRSDIIQDVGQSISPMIDIGQVEGGFIMGASFLSLEDLEGVFGKDGVPHFSAENFEVMGFRDIPIDMRVELTPGITNPKMVHSSKGIGEPGYSLGIAVSLAVRDAIAAARAENNLNDWVSFNFPLTRQKVLKALAGIQTPTSTSDVPAKGLPKTNEE